MWLFYDLTIFLYGLAIRIASLFNSKARLWVKGRQMQWDSGTVGRWDGGTVGQKRTAIHHKSAISNQNSLVIWFHCASLGEFEQGRPVMEAFRRENPEWKILLTFFSPSGYEVRKDFDGADWVLYLPLDTRANAKRFVDAFRPALAVFVKYEFWFRFIDRLNKEQIPSYVISGIFRPQQHFFHWYGKWSRQQLNKITHFFVQDSHSKDLLDSIGIGNVMVSGDTRFDRVAAIAEKASSFPMVEEFSRGKKVILAGSTWPADEELILEVMQKTGEDVRFIIAPHEVGRQRIEALKKKVVSRHTDRKEESSCVLFSQLTPESASSCKVLIIDGIGYLSHLYQYASIAYIGGGFGVGIHNILEAAAFGKPVIFGPNHRKFREALELVELGGAFPVNNGQELHDVCLSQLEKEDLYSKASDTCRDYVKENSGATQIILEGITGGGQ